MGSCKKLLTASSTPSQNPPAHPVSRRLAATAPSRRCTGLQGMAPKGHAPDRNSLEPAPHLLIDCPDSSPFQIAPPHPLSGAAPCRSRRDFGDASHNGDKIGRGSWRGRG